MKTFLLLSVLVLLALCAFPALAQTAAPVAAPAAAPVTISTGPSLGWFGGRQETVAAGWTERLSAASSWPLYADELKIGTNGDWGAALSSTGEGLFGWVFTVAKIKQSAECQALLGGLRGGLALDVGHGHKPYLGPYAQWTIYNFN